MSILKFDSFNESLRINVLDCVIDDNGVVHNGRDGTQLIKGNVDYNKKKIEGNDGKLYPAGLDKNGDLVSFDFKIKKNSVVGGLNSEGELVNNRGRLIKTRKGVWKTGEDYYRELPILPTGWVNIKVDMEIMKRVNRYSIGLNRGKGFYNFENKLNKLSELSTGKSINYRSRIGVQNKMSGIILLHYINEIKNFFTPSTAGFLFESFLAGLMTRAKVNNDNSSVDVYDDDEKGYQIKLYSSSNSSIPFVEDDKLDYYVICLKYIDKIDIHILHKGDENDENYYTKCVNRPPSGKEYFSMSKVKGTNSFELKLNNLDDQIERISSDLKDSIEGLYNELSEFQYNVESIITGVDEHRKRIMSDIQFKSKYDMASKNTEELKKHIDSLYKSMDFRTRN